MQRQKSKDELDRQWAHRLMFSMCLFSVVIYVYAGVGFQTIWGARIHDLIWTIILRLKEIFG